MAAQHHNLVTEKDLSRFMSYVEILPYSHPTLKSPCWLWTGAKSRGKGNKKWYGTFRVGKRAVRAHAFSFDVLGGGVLPSGWHRDHRCNFSLCVNPAHLEAVSPEVNQLRKMRGKGLKVLPPLVNENDVQLALPLYKPQLRCESCGGVNGHFDFCTGPKNGGINV